MLKGTKAHEQPGHHRYSGLALALAVNVYLWRAVRRSTQASTGL